MENKKQVFVIGHKNPDTDSICSAIGYADLKNRLPEVEFNYVAKRAGEISNETQFVLDYFKVEAPEYISFVGAQVSDLTISQVPQLDENISMKQAWNMMRDIKKSTMPITSNDKLRGMITVKDIATANMDIYEDKLLALAKTSYKNILDTIEGTLLVGDAEGCVETGKMLVGAANVDLLETFLDEGDFLITGNRFESQFCAIEMNVSCIVVCMGAEVSQTIQKFAKEKNVRIIVTKHDTYMVARLISQSIPVSYFMRSEGLITFKEDDLVTDIQSTLSKVRHRDFPVLDKRGKYKGMFSRRDLLNLEKKKIVMVDHNEKSQAVDGIEEADVLEIIDHHRLGTMETSTPVFFRNQPVGCTGTIIYSIYQENQIEVPKEIAGLLCSAILSDTLMFRSPTCTPRDKKTAEILSQIAGIEIQSYAESMFRAGSNLKGKTTEEIFYQDFKKFNAGDAMTFGVGQISSLDEGELLELREQLLSYMESVVEEGECLFFLLTNIITESSHTLCVGKQARELLDIAFDGKEMEKSIFLEGVVSRKKQFVPNILDAVQQL